MRTDDEDILANLIAVQGSHSPADVFFTENTPPLEFLQENDLLAKLTPSTLADTLGQVQLPGRRLGGRVGRVNVMVYNPTLITQSQLPTA